MTRAEAFLNVTDALTTLRALNGAPSTIFIMCGDAKIECSRGWSKSSIHNGAQVVFLVCDDPSRNELLPNVRLIHYGKQAFVVSGEIKPSAEPGGYWLLPVKEA